MKHTATAPPTCPSRRRGGRRFAMDYHRGDTLVAQRTYAYDQLGRPNARTITRQGSTRTDAYTYNNRSELIGDVVDGTTLNGWDYDRAAAASSSGVASRPILFTKDDNSVSVACTYDYMGRRATKVVTENGQITSSHRFLYRGYLQIDLGTIECKFAAKYKYFNGSVSSNVKQTKHGSVSENIILKCVCDSDTY